MTLVDEGKDMFKSYHSLAKHLNEQGDSKGKKLMAKLLENTSTVIDTLIKHNNEIIKYNNEVIQCCNEMMEVEEK